MIDDELGVDDHNGLFTCWSRVTVLAPELETEVDTRHDQSLCHHALGLFGQIEVDLGQFSTLLLDNSCHPFCHGLKRMYSEFITNLGYTIWYIARIFAMLGRRTTGLQFLGKL